MPQLCATMELSYWMLQHVTNESLNKIIDKPQIIVGRSQHVDVSSTNPHISRNHAGFFIVDSNLYVKDYKSINGTYINKKKITPGVLVKLDEYDEVRLGYTDECEIKEEKGNPNLIYIVKRIVIGTSFKHAEVLNETKPLLKEEIVTDDELIVISDDECKHLSSNNNDSISNFHLATAPEAKETSLSVSDHNNLYTTQDLMKILSDSQFNKSTLLSKENNHNVDTIKKENKCNYSIIDEIVINSDEEDEPIHYSQLMNDKSITKCDVKEESNIFDTIKKELEEFDKVPAGTIFSRISIDDEIDNFSDEEFIKGFDEALNIPKQDEPNKISSKALRVVLERVEETVIKKLTARKEYKPEIRKKVENSSSIKVKNYKNDNLSGIKRKKLQESILNQKKRKVEKDDSHFKKRKNDFYNKVFPSLSKEELSSYRKQKLKEIAIKSKDISLQIYQHKKLEATKRVQISNSENSLRKFDSLPSTSANGQTQKLIKNEPSNKMNRKVILTTPHRRISRLSRIKDCNNTKIEAINNTTKSNSETSKVSQRVKTKSNSETSKVTQRVKTKSYSETLEVTPSTSCTEMIMPIVTQNIRTSNKFEDIEDIIIKILHWHPIWFEEHQKNPAWGLPESVDLKKLVPMKNCFSSYKEYYQIVIPHMMSELWYFFYKERFSPLDKRKEVFTGELIEEILRSDKYTQLNYYTLINENQYINNLHIKEEDVVMMNYRWQEEVQKVTFLLGYVTKISKTFLRPYEYINQELLKTLRITPHAVIRFSVLVKASGRNAVLRKFSTFKILTSTVSSMRLFQSVKRLEYSLLQNHILKPTKELYQISNIPYQTLYSKDNLNASQRKIVLEASHLCEGNSSGIYLIQGPPGTGKTTVILNIIQQILLKPTVSSSRCILLLAPSNAAVDELGLRILDLKAKFYNENRKLKFVRLGPKHMVHSKIQDYLLYEISRRNVNKEIMQTSTLASKFSLGEKHKVIAELREILKSSNDPLLKIKLNTAKLDLEKACKQILGRCYNERLKKEEEKLLFGAEIICTTLSSCVGLRMEDVFRRFSKQITSCIVDEATQSNEQETLIPLILGIDKLILVGDPKQLPAVIQSKHGS
ncbi:hypothetical protein FQA39_LY11410 [Lamprigera yunnana]|nr:hypothetical protein FQA39_LY11410 [Lamprigera yunnana]